MNIAFQIHVTLKELNLSDKNKFLKICSDEQVKPVLIELSEGEHINQPMFTKLVECINLEEALNSLKETVKVFEKNNFVIDRFKIEVAPENDYLFENIKTKYFQPYYEWHCKIIVERVELLNKLCEEYNAHLSLNSLDNDQTKFITIREYGDKEIFYNSTKNLEAKLLEGNWKIVKQKFEYCIHDSKLELDDGWAGAETKGYNCFIDEIENTDGLYYDMIASEAFLRRAAKYNMPFMLKGSYVTRQYMPDKERMPEDIDWVYMDKITVDEANKIFTDWMIKVTETELNDGVKFRSFKENAFWRGIDYAMDDDFPTLNTDLDYTIGDDFLYEPFEKSHFYSEGISFDISFNLNMQFNPNTEVAPVPLLYKPVLGEPFIIPYTTPLSLQIAWKLHQTIVRPRLKDVKDLIYLFKNSSYDTKAVQETLQVLINECAMGKIDNSKIKELFAGKLEAMYVDYYKNKNLCWKEHYNTMPLYSHERTDYRNLIAMSEEFKEAINKTGIDETIPLPTPNKSSYL